MISLYKIIVLAFITLNLIFVLKSILYGFDLI